MKRKGIDVFMSLFFLFTAGWYASEGNVANTIIFGILFALTVIVLGMSEDE